MARKTDVRHAGKKLFYRLCNVTLFVFHICNKFPLRKAARPQRSEINIEIFVYIYIYIRLKIKPNSVKIIF
jgi:hypothetical protein